MILHTKDRSLSLSIEESLIDGLVPFISKNGRKETGGIIIGRYNATHTQAIVTEFSDKPKDSIAGFFNFIRGKSGLKKLLTRKWEINEYYLGEWHFHPNSAPDPSPQDYTSMKKISRKSKYKCPEPIMLIIGGNEKKFSIRCFLFIHDEVLEFSEIDESVQ